MVGGAFQGALLSAAEHGGVDGDLHPPLAAQPHPLLLTDHLALVLVCISEDKQK